MTLIRDLHETEKPKEKLLTRGAHVLTEVELLAIIFNTGSKGYSSLNIANSIMKEIGNLRSLKQLSVTQLQSFNGIGLSKAITLKAAIELGERLHSNTTASLVKITSPSDAVDYVMGKMQHLTQEHFVALFLNSKNQIIKEKTIFIGTLNAAIIHPREIFKEAIQNAANAVIVLHNHPSGDANPSIEDLETTERLVECGSVLGIELLDHIVIGDSCFTSIMERNAEKN